MATTQGTDASANTLQELDEALDALTNTLSAIRGCEYPRLIAREIKALIVACIAQERVAQRTTTEPTTRTLDQLQAITSHAADVARLTDSLNEREAEISRLRDLLNQGVELIETHTLTDSEGTAILHGEYQCIDATEVGQWLNRAQSVLYPDWHWTHQHQLGNSRQKEA